MISSISSSRVRMYAVLLGQVQRVAERGAARDDRDLLDRRSRRPAGARPARGPPRGRRSTRFSFSVITRLRLQARQDRARAPSRSRSAVSSARPARPARMAASLQMFSRSAPPRPAVRARDDVEVDAGCERLVARVDVEDLLAGREQVGRRDAAPGGRSGPGRSRAASSASSRLEAASTITPGSFEKPSSSTSSWLRVWSCSRLKPRAAARGADGVELVDEDDRGRVLARGVEQLADAAGADARRTSRRTPRPTARRRRRRTPAATAFASSVLPVPGGPYSRMPLRDARAEPGEARRARVRNSTTSASSSFASSTPATSSQRDDRVRRRA